MQYLRMVADHIDIIPNSAISFIDRTKDGVVIRSEIDRNYGKKGYDTETRELRVAGPVGWLP